jgi:predicted nucleic acid-binding protein
MNVVDSSAWLEYFADGPNAPHFAAAIENTPKLIVPVLTLFEVFKRIYVLQGEDNALQAIAAMQQGEVVDLDQRLSLVAAKLSVTLKLPMADSIILAAARQHRATLWTQDADFRGVSGVRFFEKKK